MAIFFMQQTDLVMRCSLQIARMAFVGFFPLLIAGCASQNFQYSYSPIPNELNSNSQTYYFKNSAQQNSNGLPSGGTAFNGQGVNGQVVNGQVVQSQELGAINGGYRKRMAAADVPLANEISDRRVSSNALGAELRRLLAGNRQSGLDIAPPRLVALQQFYKGNKYRPVWLTGAGFNQRGAAVLDELNGAGNYGLDPVAFKIPELAQIGGGYSAYKLARAELVMSAAVLKYAHFAKGWRVDPRSLSHNLDRGPQPYDPRGVLRSLSTSNAPALYLRGLHPRHPQFEALRRHYLAVRHQASKQREAQLLLVNMERWRWMPEDLGAYHIQVNIPEFRMRVVQQGQAIHSAKVVVGKISNKTPVFSDEMEYLAFHPYWNVPKSIKNAEILPKLRRGVDIMRKENLRVRVNGRDIDPYRVDWRYANPEKYDFYQPPGSKNVLGFVKFMFPNKHAVYLHDTSSRRLFGREVRLYSHGCIRVENPARLAEILLNRDKGWSGAQVEQLIGRGANTRVDLGQKIPVHVTYFTAQVDGSGKLNLWDDYYGHDRSILGHLTGRQNLIPAPRLKLAAQKNRGRGRARKDQPNIGDWIGEIFNFN